jgi:hypothetical protein
MKKEDIARVCHEVNRAYCISLGDKSQVVWEEAPEWQKVSILNGVELHLKDPDTGPEKSHENWLKEKYADGWKYGPVKDPENKLHPCMLPFGDLPQKQQSKDFIFRAVVRSLSKV